MKKIIVGFVCFMLVLTLSACTPASTGLSFTGRKAWQFIDTSKSNNERMDFSAVRNTYNGQTPTAIATGTLSFVLKESDTTTKLDTSLLLTHNQQSEFSGKTDKIESSVVFAHSDLSPISSTKTITRDAASTAKGYTANTDYQQKTTTITPLNGDAKQVDLKSGTYFDNEMIYHVIRSIPSLDANQKHTMQVVTPYDIFANGKFFAHTLNIVTAAELVRQAVPKNIYDMAIPRKSEDTGKLNDGGEYFIDCIAVQVSIAAEKSGPSFLMYLSALKFIDNETLRANEASHDIAFTTNVPIRISVEEYSLGSSRISGNEYTLTSYSTV